MSKAQRRTAAVVGWAGLATTLFWLDWHLYWNLWAAKGNWDLGLFTAWMYHLAVLGHLDPHGAAWRLLADNFGWDWCLLAPAYRLWPHSTTILAAQAAVLAALPLLAYAVWRREGGGRGAGLFLAFLVAASPQIWWADFYPGHPDPLIPAGILAAHLAWTRHRRVDGLVAICLAIAAGAKEVAGLAVAAYGLYLVLARGYRRGWWVTLAGIGYTVLAAWYLAAQGRAGQFIPFYADLLGGNVQLGTGTLWLLAHPWQPLVVLGSGGRWLVVLATAGALALLPVFTRAVVPAALLLGLNLLSNASFVWSDSWQYGLLPLALSVLAAMDGLRAVESRLGKLPANYAFVRPTLTVAVVPIMVTLVFLTFHTYWSLSHLRDPLAPQQLAALHSLPRQEDVAADWGTLAYLSRRHVQLLPPGRHTQIVVEWHGTPPPGYVMRRQVGQLDIYMCRADPPPPT